MPEFSCPLHAHVTIKKGLQEAKAGVKKATAEAGLMILSQIIGPILGEVLDAVDGLADIGATFVDSIDNIIGSISPISWGCYIAQHRAKLITKECLWETSLLNAMKTELRILKNKSYLNRSPYKKLEEICNEIRLEIADAIDNVLQASTGNIILRNIEYAKDRAGALKDILALESAGISNKVIEIIKSSVQSEIREEATNLLTEQKNRRKPIKSKSGLDVKSFLKENSNSLVDTAGRFLIEEYVKVLESYFRIVRYNSGRDLKKYSDDLRNQINSIGEENGSTAKYLKKFTDVKKLLKEIGKASITPYFTFDNDPNILQWVDGLNGTYRDLTVFGAQSEIISGIGILNGINSLIKLQGAGDQEKYDAKHLSIVNKIHEKIEKIRKAIPDNCNIKNMSDRLSAWAKYADIHFDLKNIDRFIADDLEQIENQKEYAEKLDKAMSDINALNWEWDEMGFSVNMVMTLGVHVVTNFFSRGTTYKTYEHLIDARIDYLASVSEAVSGIREYSDPKIEDVLASLKELGLMSLINSVLKADVLLNKVSTVNAIVSGIGVAGEIIRKCVTPAAKNPNIPKKDTKTLVATAGAVMKAIKEKFDKIVQKAIDIALSSIGLGSDLINEVVELKVKMDKADKELKNLLTVAGSMSEVI